MINNPAPAVNSAALPDDSDRASYLTGYNINEYVFGDLNKTQNNPCSNIETNKKNKSSFAGVLAFTALGALGLLGLSKCGKIKLPKNIKPPKINVNA